MENPRDRAISAVAQRSLDLEQLSERNIRGTSTVPSIPAHARDREYVPPDGGYGWVCVACVFVVNANTWGLNFVSCYFSAVTITF